VDAGATTTVLKSVCRACHGGCGTLMTVEDGRLVKLYPFKNYYETMAFVNALAWIAHREDHHPDIEVGYNRCHVRFSTHSIKGLSENDCICAAKINALLGE